MTALPPSTEWMLIVVSVLAGLAGIGIALRLYLRQPDVATRLSERFARVRTRLLNKYWVDEIYNELVVAPVRRFSDWLWRFWDTRIVDGMVNGIGYVLEGSSAVLRLFQTGFVGTYALFIALGVAALLLHFLRH